MVKKLRVPVLFIALLTLLLTACTQAGTQTTTQKPTAEPTSQATAGTTAEATSPPESVDYGTVRFLISESYSSGTDIEKVAEYIHDSIQIRGDWLGEQGLSESATIDDLVDTLRTFMEVYGTNPLLVSAAGSNSYDMSLGGMFLPMGYSWWKSDDGTYLPPEMHSEYATLLETLNTWYKEGIIHPESFSGDWKQLIEANQIGAAIGWYSSSYNGFWSLFQQAADCDVDIINLQPPKGTYDNGYVLKSVPTGYNVVASTSKNPEGVIVLLNWIAADLENTIISRQGLKDVHWEYVDEENGIVNATTDYDADNSKFKAGTFEFLDINNFAERSDTSTNARIRWYYDWWDVVYGNKVRQTYVPLDYEHYISDALYSEEASGVLNDVNTALQEAKVAFITGARPLSEWEDFLEEWQEIGMDKIIADKNRIYSEKIG